MRRSLSLLAALALLAIMMGAAAAPGGDRPEPRLHRKLGHIIFLCEVSYGSVHTGVPREG